MLLMTGVFFGFILAIALLILILRLLSVTLFELPGTEPVYHYLVSIVPYVIFSGAYYYLYRKIGQSKNKTAKFIAAIFLFIGCVICLVCFVLVSMLCFNVHKNWLDDFNDNSGYNLVAQLIIVFLTAMTLGFGDPKEKDWLEKNKELQS
jgi:hypothetical protein